MNPTTANPPAAPAPVSQQQPFASASLYVGDLGPDVSETHLFSIFNSMGSVASIRVCRDSVMKQSLGYAYVNFHLHEDAERALEHMNYALIHDRPCRIMWSQRDPSLRKSGVGNVFVKNLHESIQNKELMDAFSLYGNILSCKVATDAAGKSKGYGYVHFDTEESAKAALSSANNIEICDQKVEVRPYERREKRTTNVEWTNLYIKNIPLEMTEADLRTLFNEFGEITSLVIMKVTENDVARDRARSAPFGLEVGMSKGFGFVNFASHAAALAAAESLNGREMGPAPAEGAEPKKLYIARAMKKEQRQRELKKAVEATRQQSIAQGLNLYVKNLADDVGDKELHAAFASYGNITSARVMTDSNGETRNFGFVCFSAPEEASKAHNEMNNKIINNKPIYVAFAMRRDARREMLQQQRSMRGGGPMVNRMPMGQMYPGMPMIFPQQGMAGGQMQYMMPRGLPRGAPQFNQRGYPMFPHQQMAGMPPQQQHRRNNRKPNNNNNVRAAGGRPNQRGGAQPVKFNANTRNQPGQAPTQEAAPQAVPAVPQAPPQPAFTPAQLAQADPEERKNMIGEKLFPLIHNSQPDKAGKITGMLLDMPDSELLHLLESPDALSQKIDEALKVLQEHEAAH